jgi:hypothetical protein
MEDYATTVFIDNLCDFACVEEVYRRAILKWTDVCRDVCMLVTEIVTPSDIVDPKGGAGLQSNDCPPTILAFQMMNDIGVLWHG